MSFWTWLTGERREDAAPVVLQGPAARATDIPNPGATRADGWQNPFTGLGTPDRDKVMAGVYWAPVIMQWQELLALYNGSDLAAKIVETVPKEMLRRGYEIEIDGDAEADEEELADLMKYGEKLRANELITQAGIWGNLFGGAILVIGAEDGRAPDQPLNEAAIRRVRFLNVIDRRFVVVKSYYADPLQPNYGLPETYLITNTVAGSTGQTSTTVIHESRVIRFDGNMTDILTRQQLAGWSWSVMQRAYDPLRAFESAYQACANLISDASQGVFKMQNLISMLSSGEKDVLQTRMQMVDMSRSVARAVLLDAENEDFARVTTSFAGLAELIDRFMMRLSAACGIPVAILLGRSAAGMNATGDADFRAFYDDVAKRQENELAPKLRRLFHLFAIAGDSPLAGQDLEFSIVFPDLWAPSDAEQADIELKTAQKDQIYATIGAASPETIGLSRWGKGRFVGTGMTAFKPEDAMAAADDEAMFKSMIQPPAELQGRGAPGQGEQQTPVTQMPGPLGDVQAPGQQNQSPYGNTNNPVAIVKKMQEPPEDAAPPRK